MDFDSQIPRQTASLDQLMQLGRTPVKVERLSEFLNFYPNRKNAQILLHGFLNGFKVNYDGPRVSNDCNNLISARDHESQLEETKLKEVVAGRIAGPFNHKPFVNLRLSPIGLVPKKMGGGVCYDTCRIPRVTASIHLLIQNFRQFSTHRSIKFCLPLVKLEKVLY